ncbi:HAD family hydrolase [Paenibacillus piscarius]|uniref:HAD family hydrolase n=1 Tax=Paenibacillus piscarius TaxID=1089681 RepID=UPI001EE996F2|nr:HAD-IA family hydrolase [Paenibacillus piscarius]
MTQLNTPYGSYPVSAILFDKDGTLLQFVSLWGSWGECFLDQFSRRLKQRGLNFPAQPLPSLLGTVHDPEGRITDYDRNGPLAMGTMSDLYAILSWQGYLLGLSWAEAAELVDVCRQEADAMLERSRPVRPLPGLLPLLGECAAQGIPLAVVTADETAAAEKHLRWLGIRQYFTAVVGTDLVERGKPFPDMALLACQRLGVSPSGAAVIGDTNGDMRMAKAAGAAAAIGIAGGITAGQTAGVVAGRPVPAAAGSSGTAAQIPQTLLPDADCVISSYAELSLRNTLS